MKEYKVIVTKLGIMKRDEKFQDLLNLHAREGWVLKHVGQGWASIVLERDKNR